MNKPSSSNLPAVSDGTESCVLKVRESSVQIADDDLVMHAMKRISREHVELIKALAK